MEPFFNQGGGFQSRPLNWTDPAPPGYPWSHVPIQVYQFGSYHEAASMVHLIKQHGNKSVEASKHYEALWMYYHALLISQAYLLHPDVAVINGNCAQACLNMKWYIPAINYATTHAQLDPRSPKAYYRRAEAVRRHLRTLPNPRMDDLVFSTPPLTLAHAIEETLSDYLHCHRLEANVDTMCKAITLAVDYHATHLLPVLSEWEVKSGFCTRLLEEMVTKPQYNPRHIQFLVLNMPTESALNPFNASNIELPTLLKKSAKDPVLLERMLIMGARVTNANLPEIVGLLTDEDVAVLSILLTQGVEGRIDQHILDEACRTVRAARKYMLAACLKDHGAIPDDPKEEVLKTKQQGNDCFKAQKYDDAVQKYLCALRLCNTYGFPDESALLHCNCAQACLKLELYSDAYYHANVCLTVNPSLDKGYFRRAEALKALLSSPKLQEKGPQGKSFADVVSDYCESNALKPLTPSMMCEALVLAVDHKCTTLLPELSSVDSNTQLLQKLVEREDAGQKHFQCLLLDLPKRSPVSLFDARGVSLSVILSKGVIDDRLLKALFNMKMKANEKDVHKAIQTLPDTRVITLKLILSKATVTPVSLDRLCKDAMDSRKMKFTAVLVERGATPPRDELKRLSGWPKAGVDPAIAEYVAGTTTPKPTPSAEKRAPTEGPSDTQNGAEVEAKAQVQLLSEKGMRSFKAKDCTQALQYYTAALQICRANFLLSQEVVLLGNCSRVCLDLKKYEEAFVYASDQLGLDRNCVKAYSKRAAALRCALESPKYQIPSRLSFHNVVDDLCSSHRLKPDVAVLAEAIVVAVNHNAAKKLLVPPPILTAKDGMPGASCTTLFLELLSRPEAKVNHLEYLACELFPKLKVRFDASKISLSKLFSLPLSPKLLEKMLNCKVSVDGKAIEVAVEKMSETHSKILSRIISSWNKEGNLRAALDAAIQAEKIAFVACLLQHGAETPNHRVEDVLVTALKKEEFKVAETLLDVAAAIPCERIDLGVLISNGVINHPNLLEKLIQGGVNPNGLGKTKTLGEVLRLSYLPTAKQVSTVRLLLANGADCRYLCDASAFATTPLHVATDLAIRAGGDVSVIEAVLSSQSFEMSRLVDEKGQTPIHLAVKAQVKRKISSKVLEFLVEKNIIDPTLPDSTKGKSGKRPMDYLDQKDVRRPILEKAIQKFHSQPATSSDKDSKEKRKKGSSSIPAGHSSGKRNRGSSTSQSSSQSKKQPPSPSPKDDTRLTPQEKLIKLLEGVFAKPFEYFQDSLIEPVQELSHPPAVYDSSPSLTAETDSLSTSCTPVAAESTLETSCVGAGPDLALLPVVPHEDEDDLENLTVQFDGVTWEVEVTREVLKFFEDKKHNPPDLRRQAVATIYQLAEGKRGEKLAKPVSKPSVDSGLLLYEAKISKAGRVLWEKAIQFSARQTGSNASPVYSQIVRVWAVVLDHDKLHRCIEKIKISHQRGQNASNQLKLMPRESTASQPASNELVRGRETLEIPVTFIVNRSDCASKAGFFPAASLKEDEFNITTFYCFSTALVKSMLMQENQRHFEFPFKEWPLEHEIISLPFGEKAILLLGRSGTGKTTCCLYRLWNEFKFYWDPHLRHPDLRIPRKALVLLPSSEDDEELDSEDPSGATSDSGSHFSEDVNTKPAVYLPEVSSDPDLQAAAGLESECATNSQFPVSEQVPGPSAEHELDTGLRTDEILEDLHQVFITKNYVLCSQMKRRFYDMAAPYDYLSTHMDFESRKLPNSLQQIRDLAYPLFLTAREFYILLDNSLMDGEQEGFFPRDHEGNPKVSIVSTDYDHEDQDIPLDLESDSEDEGANDMDTLANPVNTAATPTVKPLKKYVEVTSLYFREKVWHHIAPADTKGIDPILAWMEIQSYIKGSERALRKGSPLSREEYRQFGGKAAANYVSHRDQVYNIFEQYQKYHQDHRHTTFLFDECDLVVSLHQRICKLQDVPWSIHCFYVDEVQDFTQAELALFLHCCRDPNSIFFTGDTAQSIMRGVAFRFEDVRSMFHRIQEHEPKVKLPESPYTLTINFRSHSRILALAQSVLDLLFEYFRNSIDSHLPEDKGMLPGPVPVLLESCKVEDLALLLSANRREKSSIEFGAHQVILVRSKEARDHLPDILKGAIVLTVFESKGLEFDDVLLYNFFKDSEVDENDWRVITTYLENHSDMVQNATSLASTKKQRPGLQFDERKHKSLNGELKYLYTAITRAKCHLWIYDEHRVKRLPAFDYWHKRALIKVVGTEANPLSVSNEQGIVFASISTREQWKIQGDNLMRRHLWEQARHCYLQAGVENAYLAKEAEARMLVRQAKTFAGTAKTGLYMQAALCFLQCDSLHHEVKYLVFAAISLMETRQPHHLTHAAKLFERLGKNGHALRVYKRARDFRSCARMLEKEGRYTDSVRILDNNNLRKEALSKAAAHEESGIQLDPEMSTSILSFKYAKHYAKLKDSHTMLLKVLDYMSDMRTKLRFLKEGGLFEEAFQMYVKQKQYSDAYRLASAQGWHDKGMSLAKTQGDGKMEASFVFQKCKSQWHKLSPTSPEEVEQLSRLKSSQDKRTKAHALLLLGMLKKEVSLCRASREMSNSLRNKVAELEAFNAIALLTNDKTPEVSPSLILEACNLAHSTAKALQLEPSKTASAQQAAQQACDFYGLYSVGQVYLINPTQLQWLGVELESCKLDDGTADTDGMLRLEVLGTRNAIADRFQCFVKTWTERFDVEVVLSRKQHTFKLHKEISETSLLSRAYSSAEVPPVELEKYIKTSVLLFELSRLVPSNQQPKDNVVSILSVFSPQISLCLPLTKRHVYPVRNSKAVSIVIHEWVYSQVQGIPTKIDTWLSAWRANNISGANTSVLHKTLKTRSEEVNDEAGCLSKDSTGPHHGYVCPPGFVLQRKERKFYHVFFFWLRSCELMREKQALSAAKSAIYYFLCNIATDWRTFISDMELVNVLMVHCTAILGMLTHLNHLEGVQVHIVVPTLYKHAIQLFDDLNCSQREHCFVLKASSETVKRTRKTRQLRSECVKMLWRALDLLLGLYKREFSVLRYALKQERSRSGGACRQCFAMVLTLLGNLTLLRSSPPKLPLQVYHRRLQGILVGARKLIGEQNTPKYVVDALQLFGYPSWMDQVFRLLHRVLEGGDPSASLSSLIIKDNKRVEFYEMTGSKPQGMHQLPPQVTASTVVYDPTYPGQPVMTTFVPSHPVTAVFASAPPDTISPNDHSQGYSETDTKSVEVPRGPEGLTHPRPLISPMGDEPFESWDSPIQPEDEPVDGDSGDIGLADYQTLGEDEEEDLTTALVAEESVGRQEDQVNIPSDIVDSEFCAVCAVPLCGETSVGEDVDEQDVMSHPDSSVETYEFHTLTKTHKDNEMRHMKFMEECEWSLDPLLKDLSVVLERCQGLLERCKAHKVDASSLDLAADGLVQARDEIEREVSKIRSSAEWLKGVEKISEYLDRVPSLVKHAENELTRWMERVPVDQEDANMQPPEGANLETKVAGVDSEEEEEDLHTLFDDEPQVHVKQSKTSKDKEASRHRKRRKRV